MNYILPVLFFLPLIISFKGNSINTKARYNPIVTQRLLWDYNIYKFSNYVICMQKSTQVNSVVQTFMGMQLNQLC